MSVGGDITKGNGIIGCFLNFPAGENFGSITIKPRKNDLYDVLSIPYVNYIRYFYWRWFNLNPTDS